MKIIREHIIVKVDSVFNEETSYKGIDGRQLLIDAMYQPEYHTRCFGIVVSVPDELYAMPLVSDDIGLPKYHDVCVSEFKTNRDIQLEIKEGDKVYFHYNCLLPDNLNEHKYNHNHIKSERDQTGKIWHYFKVKYELVFAAIRYERMNACVKPFDWADEAKLKPMIIHTQEKTADRIYGYIENGIDNIYRKKVLMVGSYVFVEPDMETWEDISIPIPVIMDGKVMVNPDGSTRMKPKEHWLVTKSMPSERYLRGWVRYCGTPLTGDKEFVRPGMYVFFQRFADTKIRFEGFDYFRMRQRHILCIDNAKSLSMN